MSDQPAQEKTESRPQTAKANVKAKQSEQKVYSLNFHRSWRLFLYNYNVFMMV